jgi:2-enoate reductase
MDCMSYYKNLFTSVKIGSVEVKNRFALAPMGPLGLADAEGGFNQRGIDYYTMRAQGGTGLIVTGVTFVENEVEQHGMPNCPCPTHNPVQFVRTSREMVERIHAYNAKAFLQMSAGFGRVTIPTNLGEFPPVAPSPIQHRWLDKICRELTVEEIKSIVKKFGEGAFNAKRAGFDGVEIHAVHEGYLLDQFAITLFNKRTDEYGGCLANRLRFAREVVEEIKKCCGQDYPVALRYSVKSFIKDLRVGALPGEKFVEKGKDLKEGIEAAKLLVEYGYDALDVDVGTYDSWWWNHPPMYQKKGLYMPYTKMVKDVVDVPVFCAGRMDDPDMASKAIDDGTCDVISLGRPLLADPEYVNKLKTGRSCEIRPCISCQEGCMGRIQEYSMINCAVNPQAARERVTQYNPVCRPKKVLVVGGGVAGCEAARVLAIRGHQPEVVEQSSCLGGNLIPGGAPDFKEDDLRLAEWYENQMKVLNIPVTLNTKVTRDFVRLHDYDAVIVATGSRPKVFPLGDDERVYTAADVLTGEKDPGEKVVIVGGGLVGCETALWMAQNGKKVTIVEALDKLLAVNGQLCSANQEMLKALIPFNQIAVITSAKVTGYHNGILTILTDEGPKELPCDSVVLAVGYKAENTLFGQLEQEVPELYLLGDARLVANIMYAIWDAFEVANHI